jgi:hypothetical protein
MLWAAPVSIAGLMLGVCLMVFGARCKRHGLMWVFTSLPFGPKGALAMGQVVLSTLPSLDIRVPSYRARQASAHVLGLAHERVHLGRHELAHVRQYLVLGPAFLPLYLLCGGVSAANPFEQAADRYARSGRGWWPFQ